ncbi:glucose-1-phosphate thymidylyltransferase (plasmid) [Streptomyces sp. NBC_00853]|uniref:inositol monophosphatase family protein n=1 Tax=Streptomyces sp. NBC_00853 TaxID=2903681 RepID=UPI002F915C0F|nr:glucose-1-phosphate thymidylyltransferase [Streptomyces sp. NBC_00853]
MNLSNDLELAHHLVDVASDISLKHFEGDLVVHAKPDGTPVSQADLEVEREILRILSIERPGDAILAEESGSHFKSSRRWIIDPIDGTIPFIQGGQSWGTHVALECDGELVIGIMSRPTQGRKWWAGKGLGAFSNPGWPISSESRHLSLPDVSSVENWRVGAFLMPESKASSILSNRFNLVDSKLSLVGDLLEGRVDVVIDEGGSVWDRAPAALLVQEAGGCVEDLRGGQRLDLPWLVYSKHGVSGVLTKLLAQD